MRFPAASTRCVCVVALTMAANFLTAQTCVAKEKVSEANQARMTMRVYGSCIAGRAKRSIQHARLVAFLSASPSSALGQARSANLFTPDCLDGVTGFGSVATLRFQGALMRGALFRALYLDRLERPARPMLQPAEIASGWALPSDDPNHAMQNFATCVVSEDRINSDAAVRAEVASEAEGHAYEALAPAFGNCLINGTNLRFSRAVMEGLLAEALYRRVVGAGPVALSVGKN